MHVGDGEVEARSRVGSVRATHACVDAAQPVVQHFPQLREGEARDENLSHLRDQDEAVARHGQRVGFLHVTGEDENELVAGAKTVVGRHGAGEVRKEPRGRALEDVDAKDVAGARVAATDEAGVERRARSERQYSRKRGGARHAAAGPRPARVVEIAIEEIVRVPVGAQTRADLIRAEARLADALTDQLGVLQQQLLELTGRDGLRLRARLSKWRERGERECSGGGPVRVDAHRSRVSILLPRAPHWFPRGQSRRVKFWGIHARP